jgi:hypothetical protein
VDFSARKKRFLLAVTMIVLLSADASAYTFAFTRGHRLKIVGYCFDGFDGCMRRGQARGVDQKHYLVSVIWLAECERDG